MRYCFRSLFVYSGNQHAALADSEKRSSVKASTGYWVEFRGLCACAVFRIIFAENCVNVIEMYTFNLRPVFTLELPRKYDIDF